MKPTENEIIISLRNISKRWAGKTALTDINFDVRQGDFIAITGPNGGGKTTLLRILLKLLKPTEGNVTYYRDGKPADELSIGYLPQKNLIDSHFPIDVEEVIASGLIGENLPSNKVKSRVKETIGLMGLESHAKASIGNLSGGQLQRALLGRAIISRPKLLVLDEPLSYVDKRFEHYIYDLVAELAKTTTLLLVSHEMSTIAGMANRHLIIDHTLTECHSAHHHVHYDCDD
ncbi:MULTISPECIES: ATP-binding cassette domain-containing protein [Duncaniella]|uniref:ATP-binding cassette domain-containing protein n=1 Tax=Duncaniella dubosii TaxID=2518971 RepID=A0A4V1D399_9BACT|nr:MULTISPECIES: ATP-binding cassette domain-containing protein [Duncaniella]MBJ2190259.1 ATP-binding cassette domain-containing protein [Muribaculaceae bacterium]QCD42268.1 ATP-binding cassette domain-containing protein [Duncaniella dubosii]HBN62879.1 zinc ABC transporter [Porphyromonadaceae bacterium]